MMNKGIPKDRKVIRKLPYGVIRYGGIFVSFRQPRSSQYYQCECSRVAIENYLTIISDREAESDDFVRFHNWRTDLGWAFSNDVANIESNQKPIHLCERLVFNEAICHLCNGITPDSTYCSPMYGSQFKQKWGWYIRQEAQKQAYHHGRFLAAEFVSEKAREIVPVIMELQNEWNSLQEEVSRERQMSIRSNYSAETGREAITRADTVYKLLSKLKRQVDNEHENIVRVKLGYKPIGSRFVSETLMYKLICELFNPDDVQRHAHPVWLKGLELDVYIPSLNLAFEYQGIQHYQPLDIWGGNVAYEGLKVRDEKKRRLCVEQGVKLVEIRYDEELTIATIKNKLSI